MPKLKKIRHAKKKKKRVFKNEHHIFNQNERDDPIKKEDLSDKKLNSQIPNSIKKIFRAQKDLEFELMKMQKKKERKMNGIHIKKQLNPPNTKNSNKKKATQKDSKKEAKNSKHQTNQNKIAEINLPKMNFELKKSNNFSPKNNSQNFKNSPNIKNTPISKNDEGRGKTRNSQLNKNRSALVERNNPQIDQDDEQKINEQVIEEKKESTQQNNKKNESQTTKYVKVNPLPNRKKEKKGDEWKVFQDEIKFGEFAQEPPKLNFPKFDKLLFKKKNQKDLNLKESERQEIINAYRSLKKKKRINN